FGTDWPGPRRIDFPTTLSSLAPPQVVLAATSRVVSAELTTKLVVCAVLFSAAVTAYRALPLGGFAPRAVASLVYVMNPFVYGRLHYGQFFVLAGYAVLPWVAHRVGLLLLEPGVRNGVITGLSLAVVGVLDLHIFLVAFFLAVVLVVAHVIAAEGRLSSARRL